MLGVKLPVVDGIYPKSNKFVKNEATGDLKRKDSPVLSTIILF